MQGRSAVVAAVLLSLSAGPGWSRQRVEPQADGSIQGQAQEDDYTSYELLAPDSHQFRILYDVTVTTPGAKVYFNSIRKGSEASAIRIVDLASGGVLPFEVVSGADARAGGYATADLDTRYIRVDLGRAVPTGGGVRLRIDKTYSDPETYRKDAAGIVFRRSLGIRRNKVVLPIGHELVACNVPSQVIEEPDGRLAISFMSLSPGAVDLDLRARPLTARAAKVAAVGPPAAPGRPARAPGERIESSLAESAAWAVPERARQDREIVYFLRDPETHTFDLYHDYTEVREGVGTYLNVVRAGSRVSNPSAVDLDTGRALETVILRGRAAIDRAGIAVSEPIGDDTEVVVIRFTAVKQGTSVRLRISETYTDPSRYGVVDDLLVWHRAFGRPRNAVVLPDGYALVTSSIPATVRLEDDGRVRLDFWNGRPDEIDVLVRARRR